MKTKTFQKIARVLDLLLKVACFYILFVLLVLLYMAIFQHEHVDLTIRMPDFIYTRISETQPESALFISSAIVGCLTSIVNIYVLFKGSLFFSRITNGQTPFANINVKLLREIGVIMIVSSLLFPLIFSTLVTLMMPAGYTLILGIDSTTIIGLIIYFAAEVIQYGVRLQELADDTV